MIYSLEVFTLTFITKLNNLTWTSKLTSFLKSRYLKTTLFSLIEWPFLWLGIFVVTINDYQYPPLRFSTSILLYPLVAIELIDGQCGIVFTWIVIIRLVNIIWGVPTTLVVVNGSPKPLLKFLLVETLLDPQPKFVIEPVNVPPLTKFVLDTTTVSILVVGMITLNNWVTSILVGFFQISATATSDTLGEA